jgi:hypothetical protein
MEVPLFVCDSEVSLGEPLRIGAGDRIKCEIHRLPLSEGRYKIGLFLEIDGVIEDWLQEYVTIDVADGIFFGTSRNVARGWEAKTVLVENEWRRLPNVIDTKMPGKLHEHFGQVGTRQVVAGADAVRRTSKPST